MKKLDVKRRDNARKTSGTAQSITGSLKIFLGYHFNHHKHRGMRVTPIASLHLVEITLTADSISHAHNV